MPPLTALLAVSLTAAAAAAAILLLLALLRSGSRERTSGGPEASAPEEQLEEQLPRLGGGVAPTGSAPAAGGWIGELLGEPELGGGETHPPLAGDAVASRLLLVLAEKRAAPLDELELHVGASRDNVARALRELQRRGLVRVEGGVAVFSERGEKLITRLREKYFEKKRWLESI